MESVAFHAAGIGMDFSDEQLSLSNRLSHPAGAGRSKEKTMSKTEFQCEQCGEIFLAESDGVKIDYDPKGESATCDCGGRAWEIEVSDSSD